ncbi:MAG: L-threonylcarbamoyladenylate synthase [Planctomycetota bacterium]|jgi:protein-tyrosine phosphatase
METKIIKLNTEKPDKNLITEAALIIDSGGLAAFPTETVYGIACRIQEDSLKRLDEVKGREPGKYYSLHIGRVEEVKRYVPSIGIRTRKLMENGWPGPITIVFELDSESLKKKREEFGEILFNNLYKDNSIGIRCPENKIASKLLSSVKQAVVAPSANLAGKHPAVDATQVIKDFSGKIEMILDGGLCKYKQSSTVVRVKRGNLEILRKGVYSDEQINELSEIQVLFVCTGNTCRSPMAEGMFKKYLAEKIGCGVDEIEKMGYKVLSAGILNLNGAPASSESLRACALKGVDLSRHQSRPLTLELIEKSDFIYGLSLEHCSRIVNISPEAEKKCELLADGRNIPDPIGQSQQVYNKCADLIEEAVKSRICEMEI